MNDILFTLNMRKGTLIIILSVLLCIALIVGVTAGIFLYKPWYNGKWNGSFSADDWLKITKKGETLKILQVTDLHVDHTNNQHEKIWENLEKLVMSQDIDLTVVTGDWTSDVENREATERLISVMEGCGKPWAVVFGNHDSEGEELTRDQIGDMFEKAEHCLFAKGPQDLSGTGNYIIQVYNSDNHLDSSLVLMDSHYSKNHNWKYMPVFRDQVKWYDRSIKGVNELYTAQSGNAAEIIPSLLFLHIPLPEYEEAWTLGKVDTAKHMHGSNNEDVYSSVVNTGLFSAITKNGSTKGVFCGHDHANTSAVEYEGVLLAYGVQTGTCESDPFAQTLSKGGNLITLAPDGTLTVEQVFHEEQYQIVKD